MKRTFDEHPKAIYWSKKNTMSPNNVALKSNKKFWFDCICGHKFECTLHTVNSGSWCSYCGNKKLCKKEDCISCFEKSFASNIKSNFWSKKNEYIDFIKL